MLFLDILFVDLYLPTLYRLYIKNSLYLFLNAFRVVRLATPFRCSSSNLGWGKNIVWSLCWSTLLLFPVTLFLLRQLTGSNDNTQYHFFVSESWKPSTSEIPVRRVGSFAFGDITGFSVFLGRVQFPLRWMTYCLYIFLRLSFETLRISYCSVTFVNAPFRTWSTLIFFLKKNREWYTVSQ